MRSVSIDFVKFITVCNLPEVPVGSLIQLSAFREEPDGKLLGAYDRFGSITASQCRIQFKLFFSSCQIKSEFLQIDEQIS